MNVTIPKLLAVAALALCAFPAAAGSDSHKHFAMMDTNKDGKVSAEEHAAGAQTMFEKMDANKDGSVDAAEMSAAHKAMHGKAPGKSDMTAEDKIKTVDTNADGRLTAAEHVTASAAMFTKMDANKDSFLSHAEIKAGHAAMMKK